MIRNSADNVRAMASRADDESDDSGQDKSDLGEDGGEDSSDLGGEDGGEDEDTSSFSGSQNDSDNVPISTLFDW